MKRFDRKYSVNQRRRAVLFVLVRHFNFTVPRRAAKVPHKDGLIDLFRNIPGLIVTDLGMVSLPGWDFVLPLRRHDPALPILVVSAFRLLIADGVDGIATAFSQTLCDFEALIAATPQLLAESGSVQIASPARA